MLNEIPYLLRLVQMASLLSTILEEFKSNHPGKWEQGSFLILRQILVIHLKAISKGSSVYGVGYRIGYRELINLYPLK
jgi:hypothetical protein